MARGKKGKKKDAAAAVSPNADGLILVDPSRVRFQYSRIRPYFSGCSRSVVSTLDSIRNGEISPNDLPPIQVLLGPIDKSDGQWYFSLNNRRLWVFKRCQEEGLLDEQGGKIWARVREPKSQKERERYTLENCAVEAKFIREKNPASNTGNASEFHDNNIDSAVTRDREDKFECQSEYGKGVTSANSEVSQSNEEEGAEKEEDEEDEASSDESSTDGDGGGYVNAFAALDF